MSAAAECPSGILTFDKTDATMAASCNVQPLCMPHTSAFIPFRYSCNGTHVQQREHDALEHRTGLVHRALQALVIMHVQLAVVLIPPIALPCLTDILTERIEQDGFEEDTSLWRLHLRDKDARRSMACLRGPIFGVREREDARPLREGGDDLEGLRERAGLVPGQHLPDSGGREDNSGQRGHKRRWWEHTLNKLRRPWGQALPRGLARGRNLHRVEDANKAWE